ncbi:MAG: hypothetical protein LBM67_01025 [Lentimicrobiaceae bacterium]|jgi:hypothetical protein|nr:hypothetical protein [Lentimicrobiaceae bacterium]
MKKQISLLILTLSVCWSCNDKIKRDTEPPIALYKMENDYSNHAFVMLSFDKTEITGLPGYFYDDGPHNFPLKLTNNYYLRGDFGINTAYLSISKEAYNEHNLSISELYQLIIDFDPYVEYYICKDDTKIMYSQTINGFNTVQYDSAFINKLIIENKLKKYFCRIK